MCLEEMFEREQYSCKQRPLFRYYLGQPVHLLPKLQFDRIGGNQPFRKINRHNIGPLFATAGWYNRQRTNCSWYRTIFHIGVTIQLDINFLPLLYLPGSGKREVNLALYLLSLIGEYGKDHIAGNHVLVFLPVACKGNHPIFGADKKVLLLPTSHC